MKNTFLKTIGATALAILMMAMFTNISVSAQNKVEEVQSEAPTDEIFPFPRPRDDDNPRALEGSWNTQVTPYNCQTGVPLTTTPSMLTFMRGGTMMEFGTRNSPTLRGPGQGVWTYNGRRQFTARFQFFRFNADGTLAGRQIVTQNTTLSYDGNNFTSSATAQILDVNGNVIQNNCSNGVGTRFE